MRDTPGILQVSETEKNEACFAGPNCPVWIVIFAGLVIFLAAHFYAGIRVPWVENDNYCGAIYAQAAHNNLRAGIAATGGLPATLYFGPLPIPVDAYYVHHPTLLPMLVTGSFALFGESEWAARIVVVIPTMLALIFLWLFVCECLHRRAATFAAAVFATLPMVLHYGDMVDFEPLMVMWMLATVLFVRRAVVRGAMSWMWLAVACCFFAVWTEWTGYLLTMSLAAWLFFRAGKNGRFFAFILTMICAVSGVIFLLQIRHVNPAAWSDLWTAVKLRLGNGVGVGSSAAEQRNAVHFTSAQWCATVLRNLLNDYSWSPLLLASAGFFLVAKCWAKSPAARWLGWGAFHMAVVGLVYSCALRNWSFIHDFCMYYLVGSVAILGGVALEVAFEMSGWTKNKTRSPLFNMLRFAAVVLVFAGLAINGKVQAQQMRSLFYILDGETQEPAELTPELGARLAREFPPGTTILCNFDPYTSNLPYYTQRTIVNNLRTTEEWNSAREDESGAVGGVLWLDDPGSAELAAAFPKNELTYFQLRGFHFALWHPKK